MKTVLNAIQYTDRTLIESVVSSFYILDYGFIKTVNNDKTVDVIHAKKLKTLDGEDLSEMTTKGLEVLTISGQGFSFNFDYAQGDKVLLLGLKTPVEKTGEVNTATETTSYIHYSRESMKALPLCVFNDSAKIKVEAKEGTLNITTENDVNITTGDNGKIKLNGEEKSFVTWEELDKALSSFLTSLTTALTTTAIIGNGSPQPEWLGLPKSIDISKAKTTTVVTGG